MAQTSTPRMTRAAVRKAQDRFQKGTAGDLFYRAATQLIETSRQGHSALDLAESIGVLLQTWNVSYYRFRGGYTEDDTAKTRKLLSKYQSELTRFRKRRLDRLTPADEQTISKVFHDFEVALGRVGAAKTLHLLAPRFFPMWDGKIAKLGYRINLNPVGLNSENYLRLMRATLAQIEALGGWDDLGRNPVKAIDEYNYCRFTREWIN